MVSRAARGFGLLLGILSIALALGILMPRPFAGPSHQAGNGEIIYLLSGPIHTDIAVPITAEVIDKFEVLTNAGFVVDAPGANWIVFGWGSREFYINTPTWSEMKMGPTLTALTYDPNSVMRVQRAAAVNAAAPGVVGYTLSEDQLNSVLDAIYDSFVVDPGIQSIEGVAYSTHDMFFAAHGGFTALLGCNSWTATILRKAGIKTGYWTPLPASLSWSLWLHN